MQPIQGLHHITAVASDPQSNLDFYQQVLGQRLVKTTVNFDDPGTYHLYYGDQVGTPGTILTFFPWRHMKRGRAGSGEAATIAYAVQNSSLQFWRGHLESMGAQPGEIEQRFGTQVLPFNDPDGMRLELVGSEETSRAHYWEAGPIPEQHALLGFHSTTLWLPEIELTAQLLTDQLGYQFLGQEGARFRFQGAGAGMGSTIDILHRPGYPYGQFGAGSIHHIAFRTVDDREQAEYQSRLRLAGHRVTPVQDRQYFHSIYFRSPGGVLFEIATDPPGFNVDESVPELGTSLKLPTWLEPQRQAIEDNLPPIERKTFVKIPETLPTYG